MVGLESIDLRQRERRPAREGFQDDGRRADQGRGRCTREPCRSDARATMATASSTVRISGPPTSQTPVSSSSQHPEERESQIG